MFAENETEPDSFVSSPGDVLAERNVLEHVAAGISRTDGERDGFRLELLKWEKVTMSIQTSAREIHLNGKTVRTVWSGEGVGSFPPGAADQRAAVGTFLLTGSTT